MEVKSPQKPVTVFYVSRIDDGNRRSNAERMETLQSVDPITRLGVQGACTHFEVMSVGLNILVGPVFHVIKINIS